MRQSRTYHAIALLSWPLLRGLYRLHARGRENIPHEGGLVLACNHVSSFDPWPLGLPLWPERQLRFMAKSELYWFPLTRILDGAGAFPVRRGQADVEAIEKAVELVRDGEVVAMFPEGTRRRKGLVKKFQPRPRSGAARIAIDAGVPLIPAAVKGTDRLLRFGPLRIAYGAPLDIDGLDAQQATERLMVAIEELEATL